MTDQMKELLWMTGCTAVMVGVGLIALVGYIRMKRANHESGSGDATRPGQIFD